MRELERRIEKIEMVQAADKKAMNELYPFAKVERLTEDEWREMYQHPEAWMSISYILDHALWYKFIRRSDMDRYSGLPHFHIDMEDLTSLLRR